MIPTVLFDSFVLFVATLKVTDGKEQDPDLLARGADPDPYQNVTDPQHCFLEW